MFAVRKYFCFELLTAGVLVGWIGLATSITGFISCVSMLTRYDDYFNKHNFPNSDMDKLAPGIIGILASDVAGNIINLITSTLLIIGTIKRNRLYLVPWLITDGFMICVTLVASMTILSILSSNANNYVVFFSVFFGLFLLLNFQLYTWVAIYSLHNALRRNQPNSEYTSLIEDNGAAGNPIYSRA